MSIPMTRPTITESLILFPAVDHVQITALVWQRVLGLPPANLRDLCCPTPWKQIARRLPLREAGVLLVPQGNPCHLSGWNGLSLTLLIQTHSTLALRLV